MLQISIWINLFFILTCLAFVFFIYYIIKQSSVTSIRNKGNSIVAILSVWITLQFILSISGVYAKNLSAIPPYLFLFGLLPPIAVIIYLFTSKKGKNFIQAHSIEELTNLHIIRIPVEFTLVFLFWEKVIPRQMSFLGSNFDILIGITTPIIAFLYFKKKAITRTTLLVWHIIGLVFLLHIVIVAILSAPWPLQTINFDQPNTAILYFPLVLLPTLIVPFVLLSHLICIKRLLKTKRQDEDALIETSQFYKAEP